MTPFRLAVFFALCCTVPNRALGQTQSVGTARCTTDWSLGTIRCDTSEYTFDAKPFHEVLMEAAKDANAMRRDQAVAAAMREQAALLRQQARELERASTLERIVTLLESADKLEGEPREALIKLASQEILKIYPASAYPPGTVLCVPMSDDGWDKLACDRIRLQHRSMKVFRGTYGETDELSGVKLLVVDMRPDANHDTLEAIYFDETGRRRWTEKVGFAWTLDPGKQTTKLADRLAGKIAGRF